MSETDATEQRRFAQMRWLERIGFSVLAGAIAALVLGLAVTHSSNLAGLGFGLLVLAWILHLIIGRVRCPRCSKPFAMRGIIPQVMLMKLPDACVHCGARRHAPERR